MDSQAKTPALRPQSRLRGSLRSSHVRASLALCLLGGFLTALGQDPWLVNTNYPMDTNASLGATVSFRVYADSTNLPLTCQWQHEGTNLPAATNFTLVLTNLAVAHAGGYMAMISNAIVGFTNSRTATLTVHPAQFKDVTVSAGVTNAPGYCISAAWGDYNNNQFIDLYLVMSTCLCAATPVGVDSTAKTATASSDAPREEDIL